MRPSLSAPTQPGARVMSAKACSRIKDHADLLGRRVVELRFEVAEIVFERAQDAARKIGRGAAVVLQIEVRGFALAIAFFFGFVALRLFERLFALRDRDAVFSARFHSSMARSILFAP